MIAPIVNCLWFYGNAEEAATYYTQLFPDGKIGSIPRYGEGAPFPAGTAITVPFSINGQSWLALNGNKDFTFNESVSFVIHCDTQEEIDHFWDNMIADGGKASMCGWLKDKFGLSWQVVPKMLGERMGSGEPSRSGNMIKAMLKMQKLLITELDAAYNL